MPRFWAILECIKCVECDPPEPRNHLVRREIRVNPRQDGHLTALAAERRFHPAKVEFPYGNRELNLSVSAKKPLVKQGFCFARDRPDLSSIEAFIAPGVPQVSPLFLEGFFEGEAVHVIAALSLS